MESMSNTSKAYMSDLDGWGSVARLDAVQYTWDERAVARELDALAQAEAACILADVEPVGPLTASFGIERLTGSGACGHAWAYEGCIALVDSLAAFVADGGAQ